MKHQSFAGSIIAAVFVSSIVSACSGGHNAMPPTTTDARPVPGALEKGTVAAPPKPQSCSFPPIKGVQVSPSPLITYVSVNTSFTACSQYVTKYTITATPSGIVSVPPTAIPIKNKAGFFVASIKITALAAGAVRVTVADARGASADLSVTIRQRIFAVNQQSNSVSVLDSVDHSLLFTITGGGLNDPTGEAVDAAGKLYVSNLGDIPGSIYHTISVFDTANGYTAMSPVNVVAYPAGLAVDAHGRLYVAELDNNAVLVLDTTDSYFPLIQLTNNVRTPTGVAVTSDHLFVTDIVAGPNGEAGGYMTAFGILGFQNNGYPVSDQAFAYPEGIAVGPDHKIYIANYYDSRVLIFDSSTVSYTQLPSITGGGLDHPSGIALDETGKLYIANKNNTVSIFDTTQENKALDPLPIGTGLDAPVGIAIH